MRLLDAKLCEDCSEIFTAKACPLCGRESYFYIARCLDRMPNPLEIVSDPNAGKLENAMPANWAFRGRVAPFARG